VTEPRCLAILQQPDTNTLKAAVNRCVLSRRRETGRQFASMTEVGRLFEIAGMAELKAQLPYAVRVRGTWSRGRVDEHNVILKAKVASLKLIRWDIGSQCNDFSRVLTVCKAPPSNDKKWYSECFESNQKALTMMTQWKLTQCTGKLTQSTSDDYGPMFTFCHCRGQVVPKTDDLEQWPLTS